MRARPSALSKRSAKAPTVLTSASTPTPASIAAVARRHALAKRFPLPEIAHGEKKKNPGCSHPGFSFFRIVLCDLAYREIVRRLKASANDNGNADSKVQSIVFRVTIFIHDIIRSRIWVAENFMTPRKIRISAARTTRERQNHRKRIQKTEKE